MELMNDMKRILVALLIIFELSCIAYAADPAPSSAPNLSQDVQQLEKVAAMLQKRDQGVAKPVAQVAQPGQLSQPAQTSSKTDGASAAPALSGEDLSMQAFAGVLNKQLPLTPEQIANLHKVFDQAQRAAATPVEVPSRPTTSSVLVNLSPNAVPPVIRLGAGFISSLVFVDSTGQPWPIAAYSVGDPGSFNIQWDKKSNTLLVQADTFYKRSNLAVILKDLNTPIMLTLLPGQSAIDYRVDLRVPGAGPNAVFARADLPSPADPLLLSILNGVPPKEAKTLRVIGSDSCQAWLFNDRLFLRTSLTVVSPAWQSIMTSIDGTHAYQLQPTSVVLALEDGKDKVIKLILEGLN